jgi:DNA modification methylase
MTDIPYNISKRKKIDRTAIDNRALHRNGKKKELNFNFGEWDFFSSKTEFFDFINEVFTEVYRVMKDSASFYMWAPKNEISFIEYILKDIGYHVRSTLVWCKTNPCPQIYRVGYMSSTEFCIFATKHEGAKHYWNTDRGQRQSYWITPICQGAERTPHPTQKRLDIAEDMITQSARKGELLLDCFAGSGTFAIAAHNLGLNYIAFERDEKIYKMAKERILRETSQMNIYNFNL